jgi:hypothetical protein
VEPGGAPPGLAQEARAAVSERLVRAAGEVALLESDRGEHRFGDRDVLGLAAVRAQARASWSSPQRARSKPPVARSGMTWKGLAHERQKVTSVGSPAAAISAPLASTTAACTRWRDSITRPRVAITSRVSVRMAQS